MATGQAVHSPASQRTQARAYRLKYGTIALSLANLCFISAWQRRLYGTPFFSPLWSWRDMLALLCNICLLACVFYLLFRFLDRLSTKSWKLTGIVYAIPLFDVMNVARRSTFAYNGKGAAAILVGIPILFAFLLILFRRKLLPAVEFIFLGLVLLLPVNLLQMVRRVSRTQPPPPLAARFSPPASQGPRVVWLVFDEMDYGLSFTRRAPGVRLEQFDRLRSQAFFATQAHQPATDTEKALPSLISGKTIYGFPYVKGTRGFYVNFSPQGESMEWAAAPNVFSDARAAHLNVGVVGWYLPYCRLFAQVVSDCYWEPIYSGVTDRPSFRRSLLDQWVTLTPLESRMRLIQRLNRMLAAADAMTSDPQLGLVLVHLPVPHGPEIYNRYTLDENSYSLHSDWFFDNVLLADRVMGHIREVMQKSGQWDNSAIIVTSDHSLRQIMMPHTNPTPLVPYMIKMPGQRQGTVFDEPFNTELSRDLVRAIFQREVTADTLAQWMRQHAPLTAKDN